MTGDLTLRPLEPDDVDAVASVMDAALRDTGAFLDDDPGSDVDAYEEFGEQASAAMLVGVVEGDVVATGGYRPPRGPVEWRLDPGHATAELKRMHVLPAHQRSGYGRAILDTLLGRARQDGYDRVALVTTGRQTAAQAFYEANGFALVDSHPVDEFGEPFEALYYRASIVE